MKTLYTRFVASTPKFWKRTQAVLVVAAATAKGALLEADYLPEWLPPILRYGVACGLFAAFIAQFTVQDAPPSNG
jgi:hypothetical protein